MKFISLAILIILFVSCKQRKNPESKLIKIGEHTFTFPIDFKLINENGIDSYVGKITDGKITFEFDYGAFSDPLDKGIDEYLQSDNLKTNALACNNLLTNNDDIIHKLKRTQLIKIETEDSIRFKLTYGYKKLKFEYLTVIPQEIRKTKIKIDTINSQIFKYVYKPHFIGLHIKNLNKIASNLLTITCNHFEKEDYKLINSILHTCQKKSKYPFYFTKQKAIQYLKNKNINISKAFEIDSVKMKWRSSKNKNDTIDSFSKEWGYLEALDDIKNKRIFLIKMGPPPSPEDVIFWKLLKSYNINVKLKLQCHPDSGAIAYNEIMYDYIDYKFGNDFINLLSKKAKLKSTKD